MASTSPSSKGIAAIVGVGPNLGRSIARKFAHEGYTVAILARDLGRLSRIAEEIAREEKSQVFAIRIDCSDSRSIKEAFEAVLSVGFVEILVYNAYHPAAMTPASFTDVRLDHFKNSIAVSAVGAFHCTQQVLPGMMQRGRGTVFFTGCSASLTGISGFSDLCCGKFALRALSQCLAREMHPLGVHVAHIVIDGAIGSSPRFLVKCRGGGASSSCQQRGTRSRSLSSSSTSESFHGNLWMNPDVIAQTYWYLHNQDRSVWTHEMDLRPGAP
ncbi:hypothetical protein M569_00701, partial [Genlisea aurea]